MKKITLILLLITTGSLFPQELVKFFSNELTDRIRFESFSRSAVNKDLEMAAKIHPELLYYYITFNNSKYDGKVDPAFRLLEYDLGEARSTYIRMQKKWFSLEESYLKAIEPDSNLLAGEIGYLSKYNTYRNLTIGLVCDTCFKTDMNKRNYFAYKYYLKNSEMNYMPDKDYGALRKEYEETLKKRIRESYKDLNDGNLSLAEAESDYSKIMSSWYLFTEESRSDTMPALYTKSIFKNYFKNYKLEEKASQLSFENNSKIKSKPEIRLVLNFNNLTLKSFNYEFTSLNNEVKGENSFNVHSNQVYAGLNFTIKLFEKNYPFSKITLEGGYGLDFSRQTLTVTYPDELFPFNGTKDEVGYISYQMDPAKNYIKIDRIGSASFKAKTPVLYWGESFNLGIGGVMNILEMNYTGQADFLLREVWRWKNAAGGISTQTMGYRRVLEPEKEFSKSYTKIYPILTAEYKLPYGLAIGCEASLEYYVAGISINLL